MLSQSWFAYLLVETLLSLIRTLFFMLVSPNAHPQDKYYVGREKSVSLDCMVDGYPIPTIIWTPCNAQENVCDQSMLNISKVQNDGVYTCTAKNSLGSDSASTSVGKSFYFICASVLCTIFFVSFKITLPKYWESTRLTLFWLLLWGNFIINERTDRFEPGH